MTDPIPPSSPELDRLLETARAHPRETSRSEFGFETRLLARLQARPSPGSAWALVSWRLIPALALAVVGLLVWENQVSSSESEAQQTALVENPEAGELLANFN